MSSAHVDDGRAVVARGSQRGPAAREQAGGRAPRPRWVMDDTGIRFFDGTTNNYGAPSGEGVTVEIAADGRAFFSGRVKGRIPGLGGRAVRAVLLCLSGVVAGGLGVGWAIHSYLHDATATTSPAIVSPYMQEPSIGPAVPASTTLPTSAPAAPVLAVAQPARAGRRQTNTPARAGARQRAVPTPAATSSPGPTPTPMPTPVPTPSSTPLPSPSPSPTGSAQR